MSDPRLNHALTAAGPLAPVQPTRPTQPGRNDLRVVDGPGFADVLDRTPRVHFSKHALQRVQRREVTLDQPTLQRLSAGVDRAEAKGSRDAVVFVGRDAFVVSVTNRTVITAVPQDRMRDHVFTNIDSAVIA